MKAAFFTLGCKVNQVETEAIREAFAAKGFEVVDYREAADVYVINTCSVTAVADKKSRAIIRRTRRNHPGALVVVTGCYNQGQDREAQIADADLLIPNTDKEALVELVYARMTGGTETAAPHEGYRRPARVLYRGRHGRTRAFIKIEDGCESFCSYCIVPYTRGPVRSKLPGDVLAEIRNLLELDYREIVLTGIHIGQYGKDLGGYTLENLLADILDTIEGEYRIRLSSLEPVEIKPPLIEMLETQRRLCRHLHIPLQSGSDAILARMNRKYDTAYYQRLLEELAGRIPGIGLTADVMVGFPGETLQLFEETMQFIAASPLNDLHVFRYSPRPGTPAAVMDDQVEEAEKNMRSAALIALGQQKRSLFLADQAGNAVTVLTEEERQDGVAALSDNYIQTVISADARLNQFYTVTLGEAGLDGWVRAALK